MPERQVLLLATRSAGKLRELMPLVASAGFEVESLSDAAERNAELAESDEEDGLEVFATFEENALAKARWFARRAPGRIVLADDSGLAVDALGGAPGVRSKRWATPAKAALGEAPVGDVDVLNNRHLLAALERAGATAPSSRGAGYVCAAVAVWAGGELAVRGETRGRITLEPRGDHGFGYDPFFASDDLAGRTFAEVTREEKAVVSHRGRAFRALLTALTERITEHITEGIMERKADAVAGSATER